MTAANRHSLAPLIAITALGAVLRFATLGDQSYSYDEYVTITHISLGFGGMLDDVTHGLERTPPLYYVAAWIWERPFGTGELGLRSLSALAGTAFIPVAYAATRQLASRRAGLIVAALAAVSPLLIWYSQEARSYALLFVLAGLSFLFFAKALQDRRTRVLVAWSLFSCLAMATHFYVWLLTAIQAVWLLAASPGDRRRIAVATVPQVATAVALLPLISSQRGGDDWVAGLPMRGRLAELPGHFLFAYSDPPAWLIAAAAAALAMAVVVCARLLLDSGEARDRRAVIVAAGVVSIALVIAVVESMLIKDLFLSRYLLFLWLPLAIVVATAFATGRAGITGLVAAVVLCGVFLATTIRIATTESLQRADLRAVAKRIGPTNEPRLITLPAFRHSRPLTLYLDQSRWIADWRAARVAELDVVQVRERPGPDGRLCWWESLCILGDAAQSPVTPPPGFRRTSRERFGPFTLERYRAPRPRQVPAGSLGPARAVFVQGGRSVAIGSPP